MNECGMPIHQVMHIWRSGGSKREAPNEQREKGHKGTVWQDASKTRLLLTTNQNTILGWDPARMVMSMSPIPKPPTKSTKSSTKSPPKPTVKPLLE